MGVRIHTVPVYKVEYGNTISSDLTDKVIDVFNHAESGWLSDDECDGEIDREELLSIIQETKDEDLKKALIKLEEESDKDNSFVRFSLY